MTRISRLNPVLTQRDVASFPVSNYGLRGDWSGGDADDGSGTNDTAALEDLIGIVPGGATIVFEKGRTYRLDPITITKGVVLDFNGASVVTKTMDSGDLTTGNPFIKFQSALGTARAIGNASLYATTVTTSTASHAGGFAEGDYVLIQDAKTFNNWDTGSLASSTGRGEINQVKSADSGTGVVTLRTPISQDFDTTPTITRIATPVVGAAVRNISTIVDTDPGGAYTGTGYDSINMPALIAFDGCVAPRVDNVVAVGWVAFVAYFNFCLRPRTLYVQGRNPFYTSSGHGYVGRMRNCIDGEFERSVGRGVRHVADYVGGARCGSRGCNAYDTVSGAYTTHGLSARDTYSIDDSAFGSGVGWSLGNPTFNADYGYLIVNPTYRGATHAIQARSRSTGLRVVNPDIQVDGAVGVDALEYADNVVVDVRAGQINNLSSGSGFCVRAADTASSNVKVPGNVTVLGRADAFVGPNPRLTFVCTGRVDLRDVPRSMIQTLTAGSVGGPKFTGPAEISSAGGSLTLWNTSDEATNWERLRAYWSANKATLGTDSGGTGSNRDLALSSGSSSVTLSSAGNPKATFASTSSAAGSVAYQVSPTQSASSGTQTAHRVAPTISQSGTAGYTAHEVDVTESSTGSGSKKLSSLKVGGVEKFSVSSAGDVVAVGDLTVDDITTSGVIELGNASNCTLSNDGAGDFAVENNRVYRAGGTDVPVSDGGTGRSTSTTAYGLIAAGTTASGAHQTLPTGTSGQVLISGGSGALPSYTASPTFTAPDLGTPASGTLTNCTFPTLNQNTTGSAATLTTARTIDGTSFNGSASIRTVTSRSVSPLAFTSGQYFHCNSPAVSSTSNTLGNGTVRVTRWDVAASITIDRLWAEVTTIGEAGSKFRIGIWNDDGTGKPGTLLLDAGQIAGDSATVQELTVNQALSPGAYWVGGAVQSAPTTQPTLRIVGANQLMHHFPLGSSLPSANTNAVGWTESSVSGAFGTFTGSPGIGGSAARIGFRVA